MQHAVTNPSAREAPEDVALTLEMKRVWNLATPVSRLHQEIVSSIFCMVRDDYSMPALPDNWDVGHCSATRWIALTQVCHGWREIAINTSLLWSDIVLTSTSYKWAEEALRRSKRCLLSIIIVLEGRPVNIHAVFGVVHKLKGQLDRCRILRLQVPYVVTKAFLKSDAPHLEQLSIVVDPFPQDPSRYGPLILPEAARQMNSLRRLSLNSCQIDWITTLLTRLTHLYIFDIPISAGLTCNNLVAAISKIPALESLSFGQCFDMEDITVDLSATTRIQLPHLKCLLANCDVDNMACFLYSVILPPFCRLRLWAIDDVNGTPHLYSVLSWLSTRFGSSDDFPGENHLRSLSLFRFQEEFTIKGFSEILSHEEIKNTRPLLELLVFFQHQECDVPVPRTVLNSFLISFPLSHTIFLEVTTDSDFEIPEYTWGKAFGFNPFLQSIFLDTDPRTLFDALIPIDDDSETDDDSDDDPETDNDPENADDLGTAGDSRTADDSETVPFSALSTIILGSKVVDCSFILDVLRDRSEHGVRLQRLLFSENCDLPPASVLSQLQEVVSYVGRQTSSGSASVRSIQNPRDDNEA